MQKIDICIGWFINSFPLLISILKPTAHIALSSAQLDIVCILHIVIDYVQNWLCKLLRKLDDEI